MNITTEAELYIIYVNGKGYLTPLARKPFTSKIEKARFFNRNCDAVNSIARNPAFNKCKSKAIIIPVPISVDPKIIFKKILKGS